ncbi:hypothetical protein CHU92_00805 [Flavobacterium cyanobacteriorum]|uniref:Uncharacterized protein n=1 Tax=Flavobacterium cyanobacteriorum TaxID=2022802 RepID=A0A256A5B0_9FLAO|nr:hypothetical protein [Flavobacterium cyanobacteriorum]OYQ48230.1 hypothetical protein CHU92_00805 [Flavobacterium cyanobacteriorum]
MTVIIIIAVVGLLIYFGTRKKSEQTFIDNRQSSNTSTASGQTNSTRQKFQSKISDLSFPDRIDAIVWHINAIDNGLANNDLDLANLSYAKLIESIRQQNVIENGNFEDHLQTIRKEYDEFRAYYGLEYPQQFLPPSQRQKTQSSSTITSNPKLTVTSNNSKLKTLLSELGSKGHAEYPLLRKEYAVTSGMPYSDFSGWVIEQLKAKDYNSLYAFVKEYYLGRDNDTYNEQELKKTFEKFLTKKFKALFRNIDEQAIFEIQAFFILKRGIGDFNREFWIAEDKEAELLCKILSVYSFEIVPNSFEPLIKKANNFLREMRKDVEFWKDYKNYKIEELQNEYKLETTNGLEKKLKQINVGERLHFFDFATVYSYRKFWNGDSSYKTRSFGINELDSVKKISELGIFDIVNDINAIPEISSKGELKETAEKAGFEIKKSWTMDKIFENLMKSEQGQAFLQEFVKDKNILAFKNEYRNDLAIIFKHQEKIKRTVDLITMM